MKLQAAWWQQTFRTCTSASNLLLTVLAAPEQTLSSPLPIGSVLTTLLSMDEQTVPFTERLSECPVRQNLVNLAHNATTAVWFSIQPNGFSLHKLSASSINQGLHEGSLVSITSVLLLCEHLLSCWMLEYAGKWTNQPQTEDWPTEERTISQLAWHQSKLRRHTPKRWAQLLADASQKRCLTRPRKAAPSGLQQFSYLNNEQQPNQKIASSSCEINLIKYSAVIH